MSTVKTFDPNQISVVAGDFLLTGFAADTFVNVSRIEEIYGVSTDVHGNTLRVSNNNKNFTITLTLSQDSKSNNVLSDFYNLGISKRSDTFTLLITDSLNETQYKTMIAWVQQLPEGTFSNTFQNRTWTIIGSDLDYFLGGVN